MKIQCFLEICAATLKNVKIKAAMPQIAVNSPRKTGTFA